MFKMGLCETPSPGPQPPRLLTVLFACLRLIAVIARTPDRDDSDESHESWLEEAEVGDGLL